MYRCQVDQNSDMTFFHIYHLTLYHTILSIKNLKGKAVKPIPKQQILDTSILKEFADDNFKIHVNGGKFSKWVENTVGTGEIAQYEQFLLFPRCFQTHKKKALLGKGLKQWWKK